MSIALVIFAYNRSKHIEQVLQALFTNQTYPDKVFIFHDGIKEQSDIREWTKVEELIRDFSWCEKEVITSEVNKGLANSIVAGLDYVFEYYDAAIVLEDDCVPHPMFMSFMIKCLEKYRKEKRIWQIGGSAWQIDIEQNEYDVYFNQRSSSWGWATWKDRWQYFERDYLLIKKIFNEPGGRDRLNIWGGDLLGMLQKNITGENDSWAVFWSLKIIKEDGFCISPYKSLIQNIGMDGSGTHCGKSRIEYECRDIIDIAPIKLPDVVLVAEDVKTAFRDLTYRIQDGEMLSRSRQMVVDVLKKYNYDRISIPGLYSGRVAIWGKDRYTDYLVDMIDNRYSIDYIIMDKPDQSDYRGIPVYSLHDVQDMTDIIIITPFSYKNIIIRKLRRKGILTETIGFDELIL